ncbi:caleosin domain containing protein [Colletotrichum higginsianum]|nr:caleosin domain containing protein [Colletotrichum higginsianum]
MATLEDHNYTKMQLPTNKLGEPVVTSIPEVPVTVQRKPFLQPELDQKLAHTGTPRANIAATYEKPNGTTERGWAQRHRHQTDNDGVIYPTDTFWGFRKLGFGIILSLLSVVIIHSNFSYPTLSGYLPDPLFRIYLANIHKDKHGSDTNTYDTEGRFNPQKFEDMFAKYAGGRDYMTVYDVLAMLKGQRLVADPIGWGGAFFEWTATYLMLWPADGRMTKEDIRGIYDGSIFYTIAARRSRK